MKPKHTQGPWRVLPDEGEPYLRIRGTRPGTKFKIANVMNGKFDKIHPQEDEENKANARLIAAAPELYDALVYAKEYIEDILTNDCSVVIYINQVLKKVKGE